MLSSIGHPQLGQTSTPFGIGCPQSWHKDLFSIGHPQLGQAEALSETSCPHSVHLINPIFLRKINQLILHHQK